MSICMGCGVDHRDGNNHCRAVRRPQVELAEAKASAPRILDEIRERVVVLRSGELGVSIKHEVAGHDVKMRDAIHRAAALNSVLAILNEYREGRE